MTVIHEIGVSFDERMGICHSVWQGDRLVIQDFWIGKENGEYLLASTNRVIEELNNISANWDQVDSHEIHLYVSNKGLGMKLDLWANKSYRFWGEIRELITTPKDAAAFLLAELRDGSISAVNDINVDAVEQGFKSLDEDDQGNAIGSVESLTVLLGVAEPVYHSLNLSESEKKGRAGARAIEALLG